MALSAQLMVAIGGLGIGSVAFEAVSCAPAQGLDLVDEDDKRLAFCFGWAATAPTAVAL